MNKRLYEESIILIGPSGAGKSTIAEELHKITNMQRVCLDAIVNKARRENSGNFKNADNFNCFMIQEVLELARKDDAYVVDFGAGHSVYDDVAIFEKVKTMLLPFKNIVLLLPYENEEKSLEIMRKRSTGNIDDNEKFIKSSCNLELATMTVYGNDRTPSEIARDIISRVEERRKGDRDY